MRICAEVGENSTVRIYPPHHHGAVDEDDLLAGLGLVRRAEQGKTLRVVNCELTVCMLVTEGLDD